jgi:hypothetical protein
LNLITKALEAVGHKLEVIPDPSTVHFHLPGDLSVLVHREYGDFIRELISKFPHEKEGILIFYGTCWKVTSQLFSLCFMRLLVLHLYYAICNKICKAYSTITFRTDLQLTEFTGAEVPRGASLPFRAIFSEAPGMLDSWYLNYSPIFKSKYLPSHFI